MIYDRPTNNRPLLPVAAGRAGDGRLAALTGAAGSGGRVPTRPPRAIPKAGRGVGSCTRVLLAKV
jgi:hypothetical protein